MKSTFKLFVIIAVIAVIGFSMAACDDGTTSGNGGGGSSGGGGSGTLTLTDIPAEYNGKYANLPVIYSPSLQTIIGVESISGKYNDVLTLPQIRDGKVAIKLWVPSPYTDDNLNPIYKRYSETETISAGLLNGNNAVIYICEDEIHNYEIKVLATIEVYDAITFTKGSVTVSAARCSITTY